MYCLNKTRARSYAVTRHYTGAEWNLRFCATYSQDTEVIFQPLFSVFKWVTSHQHTQLVCKTSDLEMCFREKLLFVIYTKKKKLRGFGPLADHADRATAASWRSSTNFCG
jgi:hypothetical protein